MFPTHFLISLISKDFGSRLWFNFSLRFLSLPPDADLIDWNQFRIEKKKKACLPFYFCTLSLLLRFIKIQFIRNSGLFSSSKNFVSSQEEAKKSAGLDKSFLNYLQRKNSWKEKQKMLFHYILLSCLLHVYGGGSIMSLLILPNGRDYGSL